MLLLNDYLLLIVLGVYITVLRMLRNKYKAFTVKQKKPIKGKQDFMDINKTVNFIVKNLIYLNVTGPRQKIINELQKNVNDMSATLESLKGRLDRQEKY